MRIKRCHSQVRDHSLARHFPKGSLALGWGQRVGRLQPSLPILPALCGELARMDRLGKRGLGDAKVFRGHSEGQVRGFPMAKRGLWLTGFQNRGAIRLLHGQSREALRVGVLVHQSNIPRRVGVAMAAPDVC